VFALVVCGAIPWKQLFLNARFQSFLFLGIQLNWAASFLVGIAIVSAFQGAILLAALSVYVVGTNSFHPRSFLIALYPALLALVLGNTAVTISQVLPWPRLFFFYVIWRLPLFFGLILSIRAVRASAGRTGLGLPVSPPKSVEVSSPGKFECIGRRRSAWCRAELSGR
jgi:hypothetical protein